MPNLCSDSLASSYNPVSDRIITMRINAKPNVLNIVQIYAPTAKAPDSVIDAFYESLVATLGKIPKREVTIILGDWNAKVGNTTNDDHIRSTVGRFGLGDRNDRGQRLIEFCIEMNLCITNTQFQHHPRRLYTWTSPGGRYKNQIDYILVGTRWKSSVRNVKTYPGAECGSDHRLLIMKFALRLKAPKKPAEFILRSLEPSERLTFKTTVDNRLSNISKPTEDANASWICLKKHICETLDSIKTTKKDSNIKRKTKSWLADDTWEMIQQCTEERMKGLQQDTSRERPRNNSSLP
ncbi:hypothetical protein ABMA28_000722 [Loxostege sticticalis]|uniref:Endonuclease/exonuclease/phosphatase domain-containing protein n=1 Tax=Loxostege sticticalis TaxID=481309 RepID=A0ABD0T3C4_LOXSC